MGKRLQFLVLILALVAIGFAIYNLYNFAMSPEINSITPLGLPEDRPHTSMPLEQSPSSLPKAVTTPIKNK